MAGPYKYSPSAGSTIKVSISSSMTPIAGADGIPDFGPEKGTYETTAISDTAKSFGDDLPDPGDFTLTGVWDSTDAGQAHLLASAGTTGVVDSFEVDYAKPQGATTAAKATFSALVLSFKTSATKGKPQMYSSKIKLTGPVTYTVTV